jgi:aspartyl-tRNA(Asn)/glutamyl-tRNA(Gln) amidotransferase subunit B
MVPELPLMRAKRISKERGIPFRDARIITQDPSLADFFERCCSIYEDAKVIARWLLGETLRELKREGISIEETKISPDKLISLQKMVDKGKISLRTAREIFPEILREGKDPEEIVSKRGIGQISDPEEIERLVMETLKEREREVSEYRAGKERLFGFFVGQVMKKSRGKANPSLVNKILKEKLPLPKG